MREIKFRWWNNKVRQMGGWEDMLKECNRLTMLNPNTELSEWIPMQYTGLHDKSGKEIYEGDILRSQNEKIWVVKFGSCLKSDVAIEAAFYCENLDGEEDVVMEWPQDEVIGNIYETSELLEPPLGNNAEPIRKISEDDWRKDDR